jgi:hypothetical protein
MRWWLRRTPRCALPCPSDANPALAQWDSQEATPRLGLLGTHRECAGGGFGRLRTMAEGGQRYERVCDDAYGGLCRSVSGGGVQKAVGDGAHEGTAVGETGDEARRAAASQVVRLHRGVSRDYT